MGNTESNSSSTHNNNNDENKNQEDMPSAAKIGALIGGAIVGGAMLAAGASKLLSRSEESPKNEERLVSQPISSREATGGTYPSSYHSIESSQQPKKCYWCPPPPGVLKLNTDASVKNQGPDGVGDASCGGVVRDSQGYWKWGYAKKMGRMTSFEAELTGILVGLNFLVDQNLKNVVIETDSRVAFDMLTSGSGSRSRIPRIIELADKCLFLLNEIDGEVQFTPGDCNKCADRMADVGANQQDGELMIYPSPPTALVANAYESDLPVNRLSMDAWRRN